MTSLKTQGTRLKNENRGARQAKWFGACLRYLEPTTANKPSLHSLCAAGWGLTDSGTVLLQTQHGAPMQIGKWETTSLTVAVQPLLHQRSSKLLG